MQMDQALRVAVDKSAPLARTRIFASVEVHRTAGPVLDAWASLESEAPCSIYQTRAWMLPWVATLGRKAGVTPFYVLARGRDQRPNALLCLGLVKRGPLRVAIWLGGKDSNFNMPLVRAGETWTRAETIRLLREAARTAGREKPDAFILDNQPFEWGGRDNPLALLRHQPSPSAAYGTALPPTGETLFVAKLSKDTRKKLRKKESRLADLGPLTHRVATTRAEQTEIIDAFLAQKIARFRAQKIASEFASPEMRAFIEAASVPGGQGIELHALRAGDRIVAVYGGACCQGRWSGMFNAFDASDEVAKTSPGDLLLMRVIAKACADGLTRFDLGIGGARYKAALCDEPITLFDATLAVSVAGHVLTRFHQTRQSIKRAIKGNAKLLAWAKIVRARLAMA